MRFNSRQLIALCILTIFPVGIHIYAAPGNLAQKPLFLGTSVPPNILYIVDDSGSMDWEVLLSKGTERHSWARNGFNLYFSPNTSMYARELCVGYNVMAYDPSKTYTPWFGKSVNGTTYQNSSVTSAYSNPYEENNVRDLSNDFYIKWQDSNNNGEYDIGECNVAGATLSGTDRIDYKNFSAIWGVRNETKEGRTRSYRITSNSKVVIYVGSDNPDEFERSDFFNIRYRVDGGPLQTLFNINGRLENTAYTLNVSGSSITFYPSGRTSYWNEAYYLYDIDVDPEESDSCSSCVYVKDMTPEQQTNYANWYTYYRKREYVAKRAISEIVANGTSRMGLATLHNHNSVGTQIKDINNISGSDPSAATNKETLLKNISRIDSDRGTPLRRTLKSAGDYFEVGVNPGTSLFGYTPNPISPILSAAEGGSCQQNFTVLMSDGYWNGGTPSVGNTDGDGNSNFDGASYADNKSDRLADVAMHYFERDLAPSLANNVPVTSGIDTNTAQHMVTFTVAFGVNGTLEEDPPNRTNAFNWPSEDWPSHKIDDMRHTAWNGRGEFLNASSPQELIDSLNSSMASIQDRIGSASAVAFNTTSITADTYVYQAKFDSGKWAGQLYAYKYDENGVGSLVWEASDILNDENTTSWQSRNIFTYRSDYARGIPFEFPADYQARLTTMPDDSGMDENQIRDLLSNAPFDLMTTDTNEKTANQTFGENIVNYFKGDYSQDATFRNRHGSRLGDIIHSSPEFVGVPSEFYPNSIESSPYFDFVENKKNRTPVIYVGANDGMLHAFHATNGNELFTYIPGVFYSGGNTGLHKLSEHDYGHMSFVDSTPVSRDVFINGSWKTYLVGGYRAGGKGIYVLDVTDPESYSSVTDITADKLSVMEFTHNDLGYSFSKPQIAKMNNGKWAAIFGNGYNSDPSGDGQAKLFIVFLDGSGSVVLDTLAGSVANNDCSDSGSDCNGLSSPSLVDTNSDYIVDRVYAGDLHGNMWVFDVSSSTTSNWKSAFGTTTTPKPLFTACTSSSCSTSDGISTNRQPITTKPIAIAHPSVTSSATSPNVLVLFGTGQYISEADNTNKDKQSFYGVWDAGHTHDELDRDDLVEQTFSYANTVELATGRKLSSNDVAYSSSGIKVMGWYIDFEEPDGSLVGERIAVDPIVSSEYIFFNTTIPNDALCSAGGSGFIMVADVRTGGQPQQQVIKSYNLGNNAIDLDSSYAGIPINAVPGGSTIINGDKVVVSDSLGRIISAEFNPLATEKNSRRSAWSIMK